MRKKLDYLRPKRKPSLNDVAKEASVSPMSVSRFLNARKRMELGSETRARIELAIQKLAYEPSPFARKRSARAKFTFGLLTALSKEIMKSGYHMGILGGIVDRVFHTGHAIKFFNYANRPYDRLEEIFYEQRVDGLLIITWRMEPSLIRLVEKTTPILPLVIFNDFNPDLKTNILYTDVREGMKNAVSYLAGKGYRKIGLIKAPSEVLFKNGGNSGTIPSVDICEKFAGFLDGLKHEHLPVQKSWIRECPTYMESDAYDVMKKWIQTKNLPQAVLCTNDEMALGALKALKEAKLWCPEKIALMGFDDIDRGRCISPSLTTMRQPLHQVGEDAVELLIDRVQYPENKQVVKKYSAELVIRQTA
ncbi:MAG: LacI family DNA-binding transcriptional regulator [Candidatus Omnitrophota bacterium]